VLPLAVKSAACEITRMAKRSKAAAAAARVAGTGGRQGSGAPIRTLTRQHVEQVARVVGELVTLPAYETEQIAERVEIFHRFVARAKMGPIDDDARGLVVALVRFGHGWLVKNPHYARLPGNPWGLAQVELLARWFGTNPDPVLAAEAYWGLVRRLRGGGIAPGDATLTARALVEWGEGRFPQR
jgi:hypothetical protein